MVCAAVSARISPNFLERIGSVRLTHRWANSLDINLISDIIIEACNGLPGTIIAESGDLYNLEVWRVKSILGRDFKYPQTIAERTAVEAGRSHLPGRTKAYQRWKRYGRERMMQ